MSKKIVTEKREQQIHITDVKAGGFVYAIFSNKWHLLVRGNTGTWPYCFVNIEEPIADPKCQASTFNEAVQAAVCETPYVFYSDTYEEFTNRITEPAF